MSKVLSKDFTYPQLREAVAKEITLGADRLRQTFQTELVRTYWNIGRVLREIAKLTDYPSADNARQIARLSKDFKRPDAFFYDAAMAIPDGMPVVWVARLRGSKTAQRVHGPGLMKRLCIDEKGKYKHFLWSDSKNA